MQDEDDDSTSPCYIAQAAHSRKTCLENLMYQHRSCFISSLLYCTFYQHCLVSLSWSASAHLEQHRTIVPEIALLFVALQASDAQRHPVRCHIHAVIQENLSNAYMHTCMHVYMCACVARGNEQKLLQPTFVCIHARLRNAYSSDQRLHQRCVAYIACKSTTGESFHIRPCRIFKGMTGANHQNAPQQKERIIT